MPSLRLSSIPKRKKPFFSLTLKVLINCKSLAILLLFFHVFSLVTESALAETEKLYDRSNQEFVGITNLMTAVSGNDLVGVKFFSKTNANSVNKKNLGGATALHIASREGNPEIVKTLLEVGANPKAVDNEGWTPLMRAALARNEEVVDMLVKAGSDIIALNSLGESAIIHAANSSCEECLKSMFAKNDFIHSQLDIDTIKDQLSISFAAAKNRDNQQIQAILESYLDSIVKMTPPQIDIDTSNQYRLVNQDEVSKAAEDKTFISAKQKKLKLKTAQKTSLGAKLLKHKLKNVNQLDGKGASDLGVKNILAENNDKILVDEDSKKENDTIVPSKSGKFNFIKREDIPLIRPNVIHPSEKIIYLIKKDKKQDKSKKEGNESLIADGVNSETKPNSENSESSSSISEKTQEQQTLETQDHLKAYKKFKFDPGVSNTPILNKVSKSKFVKSSSISLGNPSEKIFHLIKKDKEQDQGSDKVEKSLTANEANSETKPDFENKLSLSPSSIFDKNQKQQGSDEVDSLKIYKKFKFDPGVNNSPPDEF